MRPLRLLACIATFIGGASGAWADNPLDKLTESSLRRFSPRSSPILVKTLVDSKELLSSYGINTPDRIAHLLAQFATETGGLARIDENMNYSSSRIRTIFSKHVTSNQQAEQLSGRPRDLANWVYGHRLGNCGRNTDDGWNFRGSGYIQLTGRYNFRTRGLEIRLPLEENPDLARKPVEGLRAALAYWSARSINAAADANDARQVRILVNGKAAIGYSHSLVWLALARSRILGSSKESTIDMLNSLTPFLLESGDLDSSESSTNDNEKIAGALKRFQRRNNLPATGELDEGTLYTLTDTTFWRESAHEQAGDVENERCRQLGIEYDTNGVIQTSFSPRNESASAPNNSKGSGARLNQSIPVETLQPLNAGSPMFPSYESGNRERPKAGSFIGFSVIDPDERVLISNTTEYPNRTAVQITFIDGDTRARYNCSGTMISADVVLTAAHCVHTGGPSGVWSENMMVFPARNASQMPFGSCGAKGFFVLNGWLNSTSDDERRNYDLAAVRLDCKVGDRTGWLPLRSLANGTTPQTTIRGYPCDKTPAGRMWISRDQVRASTDHKFFYQNDTFGCMSGSGVIDQTGAIIAVHTNGLHGDEPWKSNNAGTRLTDQVVKQISAWIK